MSNLCLTLITPEGQDHLKAPFIKKVQESLNANGTVTWLNESSALDIAFKSNAPLETLKQNVTAVIDDNPIDFALQPAEGRRKKLLISDMDSTIIEEECIDEIAFMAGIKPKIAEITERAMKGELEFNAALTERVALLEGLETKALETVINERLHLSKGAVELVQTMAQNGAYCALVSGGFTFFTEKIAAKTGFHTTQANTLEINDNTLTGRVIPPILGSAAKKAALITYMAEKNLTALETLAVGDGANDLEMIMHAGLGIAYKAKPIVGAKADAAVKHTDLTSLLYMQGYKQSEFAKQPQC